MTSRHWQTRAMIARLLVGLVVFWVGFDRGSYGIESRSTLAIAVWWAVLVGVMIAIAVLRMGDGDSAAVVRAAELAHAHQMILSLPKGYDTEIGENAHRLSAGQSQRIGLARALYGDPRLVVLDEPNSNLDAPGEEALIQTIAELKKLRVTVIVVAHRPSVLTDMDKMLVLQANGSMAAFGSKAEVLAQYSRGPVARPANVVPLTAAHGSSAESTGSVSS